VTGRQPIRIVRMECRRNCGRKVATLNRPIHGARRDYDRLHGICERCITPEERRQLEDAMVINATPGGAA